MDRLLQMIGREQDLDEVARALYAFAREGRAPVVGAVHLTCADESELECVRATRNAFAEHVLPKLKSGTRAPFRLANLGARYEWGAAAVADEHYSLDPARADHKLLAIKINSHVCVDTSSGGPRYGTMRRYDHDSHFCGALHHLLGGGNLPFTREMHESFGSDGLDRMAALRDPERVPQELRSLFAALVNARLQARKAAIDIQAARDGRRAGRASDTAGDPCPGGWYVDRAGGGSAAAVRRLDSDSHLEEIVDEAGEHLPRPTVFARTAAGTGTSRRQPALVLGLRDGQSLSAAGSRVVGSVKTQPRADAGHDIAGSAERGGPGRSVPCSPGPHGGVPQGVHDRRGKLVPQDLRPHGPPADRLLLDGVRTHRVPAGLLGCTAATRSCASSRNCCSASAACGR